MRQQYSSYDECINFFNSAQKRHPNLVKVETIGQTWESRDIIAVSITKNVEAHLKKPALFYTGTIHAREWIGIELSLAFAKYILEHIDYEPQLNKILDNTTLYMVPLCKSGWFRILKKPFFFLEKKP
ncbi:M14 family zinc carboxypeptidase [Sulfurimonas sp. NW9]|uniref:M14 family zinc carboxypeptidase n=1 Tax=Sulfurimonas sp. NW9 TaxID=2922728 RepID=UPI003DA82977